MSQRGKKKSYYKKCQNEGQRLLLLLIAEMVPIYMMDKHLLKREYFPWMPMSGQVLVMPLVQGVWQPLSKENLFMIHFSGEHLIQLQSLAMLVPKKAFC